jgi:hypothetical protein
VFASTIDDFIAKSIETDKEFLEKFDPQQDQAAFEKAWAERSQGAVGEVHAFEPNYEGSPVVWQNHPASQVCSAKGSHQFKARAGHHLAPAALSNGKNVFEELGNGFTLLALGAATTDTQVLIDAADSAGVPLTVIHEPTGSQADRYEAHWILVRPDQFVAWVSEDKVIDPGLAHQLFKRLRGQHDNATH